MKHLIITLSSALLLVASCATTSSSNLAVSRPRIVWYDDGNYLKISKTDAVKLMQYINLLEVNNHEK